MQTYLFFAKDKTTAPVVLGRTKACAAQLVVQDDVRLTSVVSFQPPVEVIGTAHAPPVQF